MTTSTGAPQRPRVFQPASRLAELAPYQPPPVKPYVDLSLDANEGARPTIPLLAPPHDDHTEQARRYPNAQHLENALSVRMGIGQDRVLVTNGADDAIDRVCRVALEEGREMLTHTPSFEMIERSARLAGGSTRAVDWLDGPFPLGDMMGCLSETTRLVALVSPNNPTGQTIPTESILGLAERARSFGSLVLVDFAYIEYADYDPTATLLREPNVVVTRTFSKAMGLAGLRVGYALAPPEVTRWMRAVGGPYPVSALSLELARRSLKPTPELAAYIGRVQKQACSLIRTLHELGARPIESQANFVFAQFTDASFAADALASLGIAVRSFQSNPQLSNALRITLPGNQASFDRLEHALRVALRPDGLIRDETPGDLERPEISTIIAQRGLTRPWVLTDAPSRVTEIRAAGAIPFGLIQGSAGRTQQALFATEGVAGVVTHSKALEARIP